MKHEFEQAACKMPCKDTWYFAKVRMTALMAYKHLDVIGTIKLQYPVLAYHDRLVIAYLSASPREWTLDLLHRVEQDIVRWLDDKCGEADTHLQAVIGLAERGMLPTDKTIQQTLFEYTTEKLEGAKQ